MAQPRYCSDPACGEEATVLITFLDSGATADWCDLHFGGFVMSAASEMGMVFPEGATDAADVPPEPEPAPAPEPEGGPADERGAKAAGDDGPTEHAAPARRPPRRRSGD